MTTMPLEILESVSSTMDVARENIVSGRVTFDAKGRPSSAGVMAREQTAGRGQRGRIWYAPKDEALCATYYYRHGLADPQRAGQIAFLAGIAVADRLRRLVLSSSTPDDSAASKVSEQNTPLRRVGLKWPNDALMDGKKVGGILIEMVKAPDGEWAALIGVGINLGVRAFPPEFAASATSLALAGVENVSWQPLGEQIAASLRYQADRLRALGFAAILSRWRAYDQTPGRRFQTEWDGVPVMGTALGVDGRGALCLRLDDGRVVPVSSATSLIPL